MEINPEYSLKDWCWSYNACTTWCKEPNHWKRPWCWDRLKAGRDGDKGRDGWMASLTQWTWVRANSRIQWRTGKTGMLHSMGLQEWDTTATEQQMETLIRCGLWTQGGMNRKSKEDLKMVKYMLPWWYTLLYICPNSQNVQQQTGMSLMILIFTIPKHTFFSYDKHGILVGDVNNGKDCLCEACST